MGRAAFFVALLLPVLILAGWFFGRDGGFNRTPQSQAAQSDTGPIVRRSVIALGKIEPALGVVDVAGPAGERLSELRVAAGDFVREGDVLAIFESYAVRSAEYLAAEAAVNAAELQQQKIREATRTQLDQIDAEQRELNESARLSEKTARGRIELLEGNLREAEGLKERLAKLANTNSVSDQEIRTQQLVVDRSRTELETARIEVEQALSTLNLAMEKLQIQEESVLQEADRVIAALAISALRAQVAVSAAARDRGLVTAPMSGTILSVSADTGEAPRGAFLQLANLSKIVVVAEVFENDISHIRPGLKAEVTAAALSDPLSGNVTQVAGFIRGNEVTSLDPGARTDTRVVEVVIDLENPAAADRLIGLQVQAEIFTGPIESPPPKVESEVTANRKRVVNKQVAFMQAANTGSPSATPPVTSIASPRKLVVCDRHTLAGGVPRLGSALIPRKAD